MDGGAQAGQQDAGFCRLRVAAEQIVTVHVQPFLFGDGCKVVQRKVSLVAVLEDDDISRRQRAVRLLPDQPVLWHKVVIAVRPGLLHPDLDFDIAVLCDALVADGFQVVRGASGLEPCFLTALCVCSRLRLIWAAAFLKIPGQAAVQAVAGVILLDLLRRVLDAELFKEPVAHLAVSCSLVVGKDIILEIEVMGALNVKKQFPDALLIFISAPSISELRNRLAGRGTESEETIIKRLKKATEEAEDMDKYDYVVVNDDLEECIHTVDSVIRSYGCRRDNQLGYIAGIKEELAEIRKL